MNLLGAPEKPSSSDDPDLQTRLVFQVQVQTTVRVRVYVPLVTGSQKRA